MCLQFAVMQCVICTVNLALKEMQMDAQFADVSTRARRVCIFIDEITIYTCLHLQCFT